MPDQFWNLTFAEFDVMVQSHIKKQKNRTSELLSVAWYCAKFYRVEKMPSLKSILDSVENTNEQHEQTDNEMLAMVKILNAAFGGKVVEV